MPPSPADELPLLEFPDPAAWRSWLHDNHADSAGIWMVFAKKGAPRPTLSFSEALEIALCFGWIDSQVRRLDESFYRQRFTPRRRRSRWSQINRAKATELIERGLMQPAGHAEVERAKEDGRWDAAYASPSKAEPPKDFLEELSQDPAAEAVFATLSSANRYAILYRIEEARRPETRARRIAQYVEMLADRRTFH